MTTEFTTLLMDMAVFLAALFLPMLILAILMLLGQVWTRLSSVFGKRSPRSDRITS